MQFQDFALTPELLKTITEIGYETPTIIQQQAIEPALSGRDVLAIAQTGTGKTAAFLLPLLTRMYGSRARTRMPRCIILEPTRELAGQVLDSCNKFTKNLSLDAALLIGGTSSKAQEAKMDMGVDILIATPGRFLDQYEKGKLLLNDVQYLVIDEADRMLDMGFIPDIEKICSITPFTKQTLLFSATMPEDISNIAEKFMSAPVRIEIAPEKTTNENVTHFLININERKKRELLRSILKGDDIKSTIIFANSRKTVSVLSESMLRHGYSSAALHGEIVQHLRNHVLEQFRAEKCQHLIATDVAARGIDVAHVSHVINFDLPYNPEDYVHRIGRTGRGGRTGTAYSFVDMSDERQAKSLKAIENFIDKKITIMTPEEFGLSFEQDDDKRSKPISLADKRQQRQQKHKRDNRHNNQSGDVQSLDYDPKCFADLPEIPAFLLRG